MSQLLKQMLPVREVLSLYHWYPSGCQISWVNLIVYNIIVQQIITRGDARVSQTVMSVKDLNDALNNSQYTAFTIA